MIIARLAALLTANSTQFESSLKRANSAMSRAKTSWNSDLNQAGRSFSTFDTHVRRSIGSVGDLKTQLGGVATAVASALSVQKIIQYSDTWKQLEGRLSIVSKNMEQVKNAQADLFKIAQQNSAPLVDVTDAYLKMSLAIKDSQKDQIDLIQVTDLLSKTLKVSGTSATGAATFLQQFGQAASSDFKAIGQEIQTFQDQNAFFVKVLQENIDTGGRSLKQFAADGDLSFSLIADALVKAQGRINTAAESIPVTVGQALTQLDNAFLQFIGQTEAVKVGTGSLALTIKFMADNFNILAVAAGGLITVLGARMIGSMAAVAASFVAATASSYAYQLALARMAGLSATAATATLGLSGALNIAGGAIAALGGPLGVAIIGTMGLMALRTYQAGEAQRVMNERLAEHREAVQGFIFASKERRKEIEDATRQNISNLKKELEAVVVLFNAYQNKSFAGRFLQNLGAEVGLGKGVKQIVNEGAALEKALAELEKDLATMENFKGGSLDMPTATGGGGSGKQENKLQNILGNLREQSEQINLQTQLYGQKEGAIKRAEAALKLEQDLRAADINLTKAQQAEVEKYLALIEQNIDQNAKLEKSYKAIDQAAESMGQTAGSAITDIITEAKEFADVMDIVESALKEVEKALVKAFIGDPIAEAATAFAKGALSSQGEGGGGFFSFIGDLFGGSFASGIDYVPNDMYAKLHKGEAVVRAQEVRDGMGGGGNVIVNVFDSQGNKVGSQTTAFGNSGSVDIQLDRAIAKNITKKGSLTDQALTARSSQTLINR